MNRIKHILLVFAVCIGFALTSCGSDEPTPPPTPTPSGNRTILVYMVANNSLGGSTETSGYDYSDRQEMIAGAMKGDLNGCRWIVYYAPKHGAPVLEELTEDGFTTLKTYSNTEYSVSLSRMKEVFADMKGFAPASEYGLILWSHANGWQQNGMYEYNSKSLKAFGDDRGKMMNITTLRDALQGQGFKFLYADVCYFSSVEVVYELRDVIDCFAGCAARLPADGMPYDLNMKYFTAENYDLVSAATTTFAYYNDRPDPSDRWCTMSVMKTAGMDRLAQVTKQIYQASDYPQNYHPQVMEDYGICYYYDLQHFVQALGSPLFTEWQAAIDDVVIYKAATANLVGGTPIRSHCGLSTYIMPDEIHSTYKNYNTLSWYNDVAQYQPLPQ